MFIIMIVFYYVLTPSSPVSSQDFFCSLRKDQSRDVTPRLGVFIIISVLPIAHASSFCTTIILQLCSNRCAEALWFAFLNRLFFSVS